MPEGSPSHHGSSALARAVCTMVHFQPSLYPIPRVSKSYSGIRSPCGAHPSIRAQLPLFRRQSDRDGDSCHTPIKRQRGFRLREFSPLR